MVLSDMAKLYAGEHNYSGAAAIVRANGFEMKRRGPECVSPARTEPGQGASDRFQGQRRAKAGRSFAVGENGSRQNRADVHQPLD